MSKLLPRRQRRSGDPSSRPRPGTTLISLSSFTINNDDNNHNNITTTTTTITTNNNTNANTQY